MVSGNEWQLIQIRVRKTDAVNSNEGGKEPTALLNWILCCVLVFVGSLAKEEKDAEIECDANGGNGASMGSSRKPQEQRITVVAQSRNQQKLVLHSSFQHEK